MSPSRISNSLVDILRVLTNPDTTAQDKIACVKSLTKNKAESAANLWMNAAISIPPVEQAEESQFSQGILYALKEALLMIDGKTRAHLMSWLDLVSKNMMQKETSNERPVMTPSASSESIALRNFATQYQPASEAVMHGLVKNLQKEGQTKNRLIHLGIRMGLLPSPSQAFYEGVTSVFETRNKAVVIAKTEALAVLAKVDRQSTAPAEKRRVGEPEQLKFLLNDFKKALRKLEEANQIVETLLETKQLPTPAHMKNLQRALEALQQVDGVVTGHAFHQNGRLGTKTGSRMAMAVNAAKANTEMAASRIKEIEAVLALSQHNLRADRVEEGLSPEDLNALLKKLAEKAQLRAKARGQANEEAQSPLLLETTRMDVAAIEEAKASLSTLMEETADTEIDLEQAECSIITQLQDLQEEATQLKAAIAEGQSQRVKVAIIYQEVKENVEMAEKILLEQPEDAAFQKVYEDLQEKYAIAETHFNQAAQEIADLQQRAEALQAALHTQITALSSIQEQRAGLREELMPQIETLQHQLAVLEKHFNADSEKPATPKKT